MNAEPIYRWTALVLLLAAAVAMLFFQNFPLFWTFIVLVFLFQALVIRVKIITSRRERRQNS